MKQVGQDLVRGVLRIKTRPRAALFSDLFGPTYSALMFASFNSLP